MVRHAYPLSCARMRREVHEERLGRFIARLPLVRA
jgi:hypothetical protein